MPPVFHHQHEIADLRGVDIPDSSAIRHSLSAIIERLKYRIAVRRLDGKPYASELRELAALAVALRLFEEYRVSDTDPVPADEEIVP